MEKDVGYILCVHPLIFALCWFMHYILANNELLLYQQFRVCFAVLLNVSSYSRINYKKIHAPCTHVLSLMREV